jgi:hypothetical protein
MQEEDAVTRRGCCDCCSCCRYCRFEDHSKNDEKCHKILTFYNQNGGNFYICFNLKLKNQFLPKQISLNPRRQTAPEDETALGRQYFLYLF